MAQKQAPPPIHQRWRSGGAAFYARSSKKRHAESSSVKDEAIAERLMPPRQTSSDARRYARDRCPPDSARNAIRRSVAAQTNASFAEFR